MMKKIEPKILIKPQPNILKTKEYHLTERISNGPFCEIVQMSQGNESMYLEKIGEKGVALTREILALQGVVKVGINPYALMVTKGDAFEWYEIEPDILEILKNSFGQTEREIKIICVGE